jgi:uncharacterized protein (DUF779 family)
VSALRISESAAAVIREVRSDRGGTLTITIDGGCCEGTAPHLYEDYVVPAGCIEIGRFDDIPVYIPGALREQYADTRVIIDVIDDPLSDAMSLETALGKRLILRHD